MTEIHCKKCDRFLLEASMFIGKIKCPKCKRTNEVRLVSQKVLTDYGIYRTTKVQPGKDA